MINSLIGRIIIVTLLPAFLVSYFLLRKGQKNHVHKPLFIRSMIWGILLVLPMAYIISQSSSFLTEYFSNSFIFRSFFPAAFLEEICKFTIFVLLIYRSPHYENAMSGVLYSAAIATGFATGENILYLLGAQNFITVFLIRTLSALPLHLLCAAYIGIKAYTYKQREERLPLWIVLIPILIHGTYNLIQKLPYPAPFIVFPMLLITFYALIVTVKNIDR